MATKTGPRGQVLDRTRFRMTEPDNTQIDLLSIINNVIKRQQHSFPPGNSLISHTRTHRVHIPAYWHL